MKIKIENQKLADTINFFYSMKLKGQQSRHRTHFIKTLNKMLQEFINDEQSMRKEECYLDKEGKS